MEEEKDLPEEQAAGEKSKPKAPQSKLSSAMNVANMLSDPNSAVDAGKEHVKNLVKKKIMLWLLPIITPIIITILTLLAYLTVAAAIIAFLMSMVDTIYEGTDRLYNLFSYGTFDSSEEVFMDQLKDKYEEFNALNNKEGELELQLILSTINYSRIFGSNPADSDAYSDSTDLESPDSKKRENLRSFYTVMNSELGSAFSFNITDRGLIGNLIDIKFKNKCIPAPKNIFDIGGYSAEYLASLEDSMNAMKYMFKDGFWDFAQFMAIWTKIYEAASYADQGVSYFSTLSDRFSSGMVDHNPVARLVRIVKNSEFTECADNQVPIPTVTYYPNEDLYRDYLINHFVPRVIMKEEVNPTGKNLQRARAITEEIFSMRDTYNEIVGTTFGIAPSTKYMPGMDSFPFQNNHGTEVFKRLMGSPFGLRTHPVTGEKNKMHKGVDFSIPTGTPLKSVADGEVVFVDGLCNVYSSTPEKPYECDGYGRNVLIKHDVGFYSQYAHMSLVKVKKGQRIGGGQEIGLSGGGKGDLGAGRSTGSHLHFEIRNADNKAIDPLPFLRSIADGKNNGAVYISMKNQTAPYCTGNETLQNRGAMPIAYSIIGRSLGKEVSPENVASVICSKFAQNKQAFILSAEAKKAYGIEANLITSITADSISTELAANKYVMVYVEGGWFNQNGGGHYVVITKKENGSFLILDPANENKNKFYSAKDFESNLIKQAKSAWTLKGV